MLDQKYSDLKPLRHYLLMKAVAVMYRKELCIETRKPVV